MHQIRAAVTFDTFYEDFWPKAVRIATMFVQNSSAGEEIAQDAFVKILPRWETLERPEAYMQTAIYNAANSWHTQNKTRRSKLPFLISDGKTSSELSELADVVGRLPFRQRAVIVLRYYGGFSEAQIAEYLGCRPGTVKSLASRALKVLSREVVR